MTSDQETSQEKILKQARIALVRKYLENPRLWPDGIDWGSHWYTSNKDYWDRLAKGGDPIGEPSEPESNMEEPEPLSNKPLSNKTGFDKAEYMREYMRKKRAEEHPIQKGKTDKT